MSTSLRILTGSTHVELKQHGAGTWPLRVAAREELPAAIGTVNKFTSNGPKTFLG